MLKTWRRLQPESQLDAIPTLNEPNVNIHAAAHWPTYTNYMHKSRRAFYYAQDQQYSVRHQKTRVIH